MRVLIIIFLLVVAGLAASPWFVGGAVESSLQDQLAEFDQLPGYNVTVLEYERGYLASTATIAVGIDTEFYESMAADFEDTGDFDVSTLANGIKVAADIQHGPLLTAHGLSLGWTDISAIFGRESQPEFEEFFDILGQDILIEWGLHFGLFGSGWFATEFSDVDGSYEQDGVEIDFVLKGMENHTIFTNSGTSFTGDGTLEELSLVLNAEEKMSISIEDLTIDGDMILEDSIWFGVGEGEGSIGSILVSAGDEFDAEIEELSFHAEITEGSSSETISLRESFRTESASFNGYEVKDAELAFAYANISKELLESQMFDTDLYTRDDSGGLDAETEERYKQLIGDALAYSPKINLESIAFETEDGQFDASMSAEIDSSLLAAGAGLDNPFALIPALTVFADLEVSEPILRYILLESTKAQMASVPEDQRPSDAEIVQGVDVQLSIFGATLAQQGYIEVEGDLYSSDFSFSEGMATLNGQEIPLPGF